MVSHVAFIDAAFLKAEGGRALRIPYYRLSPAAAGVVRWLEGYNSRSTLDSVYWYDAAHPDQHRHADSQRAYFTAIARTANVNLRLGRVQETTPAWQADVRAALVKLEVDLAAFERLCPLRPVEIQKGVDTRLAVDLAVFAAAGALDTAIVVSGDADLAPALERAREFGCRIVLAHPGRRRTAVAEELVELAHEVIPVAPPQLRELFIVRSEDPSRRPAAVPPSRRER